MKKRWMKFGQTLKTHQSMFIENQFLLNWSLLKSLLKMNQKKLSLLLFLHQCLTHIVTQSPMMRLLNKSGQISINQRQRKPLQRNQRPKRAPLNKKNLSQWWLKLQSLKKPLKRQNQLKKSQNQWNQLLWKLLLKKNNQSQNHKWLKKSLLRKLLLRKHLF